MKRILVAVLPLFFAFSVMLSVSAAEVGIYGLENGIPDELLDHLPDGIFSEDEEESAAALEEMTDFAYIAKYIIRVLSASFPDISSAFFSLLVTVVLCGAVRLYASNINVVSGNTLPLYISFCLASLSFRVQYTIVIATEEYLSRIAVVIRSMIPLMSAIYAAGGNLSGAAVNGCGMLVFLSVCEIIMSGVLMPVVKLCYSLSFAGLISGSFGFGRIGAVAKKAASWGLTFIASVIGAVSAFQSVLSQSADSAASRIVKFSFGSFIPIVGSALSDTVKTMAAGLSLVKNSVGIFGIVIILMIALPPLISVSLHKLSFSLLAAVSGMLGCDREERFFMEVSSLQNLVIAIITVSSLLFVMSLSVFIASSLAIGT